MKATQEVFPGPRTVIEVGDYTGPEPHVHLPGNAGAVVKGPPSLGQRLLAASRAMSWVEKRGENTFHHYKYAMAADVFAMARTVLAEHGIVMVPSVTTAATRVVEGMKGSMTDLTLVVRLFNADDPTDEVIYSVAGSGADTGDKGVYKAMTGALKYALILAFLLPTGDDPEADEAVDRRGAETPVVKTITEAQLLTLQEWLSQVDGAELKVLKTLQVKALGDLTEDGYSRALHWIRKEVAKGRTS